MPYKKPYKSDIDAGDVHGRVSVETWWDRYSRNWVTQINDADGNQITVGADYTGNRPDAELAHDRAVERAENGDIDVGDFY